MALQRAKRRKPFGGNQRDALKAQHARDIANLKHEHEQVLDLERAMRRGETEKNRKWDLFPHAAFAEVLRTVTMYDATAMKLESQFATLLRWLRGQGAENWNDQITREAREAMTLAGLTKTSRLSHAQRGELEEHCRYYLDERGVHGTYRELYLAIRAALAEIDRLRLQVATGKETNHG